MLDRYREEDEIEPEIADVKRISVEEEKAPRLSDPQLRAVLTLGAVNVAMTVVAI